MRFYYDPVSSRLEPIGFDAMVRGSILTTSIMPMTWRRSRHLPDFLGEHYVATLFQDLELYREYLAGLEEFSDPQYLQQLLD